MKSKEEIIKLIDVRKKRIENLRDLKLIANGMQFEFINLSIDNQQEIIDLLEWILDE